MTLPACVAMMPAWAFYVAIASGWLLTVLAFVVGALFGRANADLERRRSLAELAEEAAAVAYELESDPDSPLNRRRAGSE